MINERSPGQDGFARFSDDRKFRYRLQRAITPHGLAAMNGLLSVEDRTAARVVFVMLNPSTADAFKLDPTVKKCCKFAARWNADVLEVVNLFALRSPYPADLYGGKSSAAIGADAENDAEILEACRGAWKVVAAWGNHGGLNGRASFVRELLEREGVKLQALGKNDNGSPLHPLARGVRTVPLWREPAVWP